MAGTPFIRGQPHHRIGMTGSTADVVDIRKETIGGTQYRLP
ncbi:MAG: hypothetical protein P3W94_006890 [Paracoccus sp. (in: a-proteobacteria)]|nr:hypothetical protein [Paracoccus sp. (in: a-proteobacteria)]